MRRRTRRFVAAFLAAQWLAAPAVFAGSAPRIPGFYGGATLPTIVPGQLPVRSGSMNGVGSVTTQGTKMTVDQTAERATIDWSSFNIGSDAWVRFDQKGNRNWVALNRIHDADPSQIYGRLSADGKVFLYNRNGILFGPGSRVDVHTLVASSLAHAMSEEAFLNPANAVELRFADDGSGTGAPGAVSNHGTLTAQELGAIFLLGPKVGNAGSISAPTGQAGLVAGTDVTLAPDASMDTSRAALVATVSAGAGEAVNLAGGRIETPSGLAGMYGRDVRQDGIIRAVTAIKRNGQIELLASDRVATGKDSVTETPVSDSDEAFHESFTFLPGAVGIGGLSDAEPLRLFSHEGTISAPSGTVSAAATDRIFLAEGSRIDVSGVWNGKPASAREVKATLNSVALRDAQLQKDGALKNEEVTFDAVAGSGIGDVSGSLSSQEMTAAERSAAGGTINLDSGGGDIVLMSDASLAFAGGGTVYGEGTIGSSKVVAGNRVYDISSASSSYDYSMVLSDASKTHARFGIVEERKGLYYGGAAPLRDRAAGITEGADAGKLLLQGRQLFLDGMLDGHATAGVYQTLAAEPVDAYGGITARGRKTPSGGTVVVGGTSEDNPFSLDQRTNEIVIAREASPLPASFGTDTPAPGDGVTRIADSTLSDAGLSNIQLYANYTIGTEAGAVLSVVPGGSIVARARRIEHAGEIEAPSGSIRVESRDNITSPGTPQPPDGIVSRVVLLDGSRLDASGEKVDNFLAGKSGQEVAATSGRVEGGTVQIKDLSVYGDGVLLAPGSTVAVDGGWTIDRTGAVTGGNAGRLDLQGNTIALDGTVSGLAVSGKTGGKFVAHATRVDVVAARPEEAFLPDGFAVDGAIPDEAKGRLLIAGDRFADTGFTQTEMKSRTGVTVESGAVLAPSASRASMPEPGVERPATGVYLPFGASDDIRTVSPDIVGATSVSLSQDTSFDGNGISEEGNFDKTIGINSSTALLAGGSIRVAPGGAVTLAGPSVAVDGRIDAPAGTVSLQASLTDVTVGATGAVAADGFDKATASAIAKGVSGSTVPMAGGTVSMTSSLGSVLLSSGSVVSVRGAEAVVNTVRGPGEEPVIATVAGDAGSIAISYAQDADLSGEIRGDAPASGGKGGSFSISRGNDAEGIPVTAADIARLGGAGFDALTFGSPHSVLLQGSFAAEAARSITLDAPVVAVEDGASVSLSSAWTRLTNSSANEARPAVGGTGTLELRGGFVDVDGSVAISGVSATTLSATRDIRLADRLYSSSNDYAGLLSVPGELTLQAARIYPTTGTDFTLDASGKLTVLSGAVPGNAEGPVLSAGGSLAVRSGEGIEVLGRIEAPLGSVTIDAGSGRAYLAEGSVVSTAGSDVPINYGLLDDDFAYLVSVKREGSGAQWVDVSELPSKTVSILGSEVVVRDGAAVDVSGGGSIFAHKFLPGIEGSADPLTVKNRFVIVPGGTVTAPGNAVYIAGGAGLPPGTYSLLPMSYAFLPGAKVVTALGSAAIPGKPAVTSEGYPVVAAQRTTLDTSQSSGSWTAYSVRDAAEVLREGNFTVKSSSGADAGSISIAGSTTILDGTLRAQAAEGGRGGAIALSGRTVTVTPGGTPLPADFSFDTPFEGPLAALQGTLRVDSSALSDKGFAEIRLGDHDPATGAGITETVTLEAGSSLAAPSVVLSARDAVTLAAGASVDAVAAEGGAGTATLATSGKVTVEDGAVVHATDEVVLEAAALDLRGSTPIQVDRSSISLKGRKVWFVSDEYAAANAGTLDDGLYITESLWNGFSGIENVTVDSAADIVFRGDRTLSVDGTLSFDAARVAALDPDGDGAASVTLSSGAFRLSNGKAASGDASLSDTGTMTVQADTVTAGAGEVRFDGIGSLRFDVSGDLLAAGAGAVVTEGNLSIRSARIAARRGVAAAAPYQVSDFRFEASGTVATERSEGVSGSEAEPGGSIELRGSRVDVAGTIEAAGGRIALRATGAAPEDGVTLRSGSELLAAGVENRSPSGFLASVEDGGRVAISAASGSVVAEAGSTVDVSAAAAGGNAGRLSVDAAAGTASLLGAVRGGSAAGKGGELAVDAAMVDLAAMNAVAASGGFTGAFDVRTRTGDLSVAAGETVRAGRIRLVADGGAVSVAGTLDASGADGGNVEAYAGTGMTLQAGARIDAGSTNAGAEGGSVTLGVSSGTLATAAGSMIDVSGGPGGDGGTVSFRAPRTADDVAMTLDGAVAGASRVQAEAFRIYDGVSTIGQDQIAQWLVDTQGYMTAAAGSANRLLAGGGIDPATFHFLPGLEIRSPGAMAVSADWDFTPALDAEQNPLPDTGWRFGSEPGILTLRAAGDLLLTSRLVDHPTPYTLQNQRDGGVDSWSFRLAAGADLAGADPMAVNGEELGSLSVADGALVYTESGSIRTASGGRTEVGAAGDNPSYMISSNVNFRYSVGTYDGAIEISSAGDVAVAGAVQSATGSIDILADGDLDLSSSGALGAVRTTGFHPFVEGGDYASYRLNFWEYTGGGAIRVDAGGNVLGGYAPASWDVVKAISSRNPPGTRYEWSGSYEAGAGTDTFRGIGTLGGGSVTVRAGGDYAGQAGAFNGGDLDIRANGDLTGRFVVGDGTGTLHAMGGLGSLGVIAENGQQLRQPDPVVAESGASSWEMSAQGTVVLGTVLNPTIAHPSLAGTGWNLSYASNSSVRVFTKHGDVHLTGQTPWYPSGTEQLSRILPPVLDVRAGRDIRIENAFSLAPSAVGSLVLEAGRDIDGAYSSTIDTTAVQSRGLIVVADLDPAAVFGPHGNLFGDIAPFKEDFFDVNLHSAALAGARGDAPLTVEAVGDIRNLQLAVPDVATVSAGGDIRDLFFVGQNLEPSDATTIRAGGDIVFSSNSSAAWSQTGIEIGGPGTLLVQAGGDIDLGTTKGVQSYGNAMNSTLGTDGSEIFVIAGVSQPVSPDQATEFLDALRTAGTSYVVQKSAGDPDGAQKTIDAARAGVIVPFLQAGGSTGEGNIDMVSSQVSTTSGEDSVSVIARGTVNVGKSTIILDTDDAELALRNTGIYTAKGGAINLFSTGDINVNEARVMTFQGGDITAWSDTGDINAGRGSQTAISADPPKLVDHDGNDKTPKIVEFSPPAVGSGIRTLTYAPGFGQAMPPAGDIYLFAPTGAIDAGEAGIAGTNVFLGATQVLNANRISFSAQGMGVPAQTASVNLGALAGAGALAEATKSIDAIAAVEPTPAERAAAVEKTKKEFSALWLDVKVLSFDSAEGDAEEEKR